MGIWLGAVYCKIGERERKKSWDRGRPARGPRIRATARGSLRRLMSNDTKGQI